MKSIKGLICILVIFIGVYGLSQKVMAADDLYITDWLVEADIMENGDLSIREDLTFDFNDKFNGVFREIILNKTSGVTDIAVEELVDGRSDKYRAVTSARNGDSKVFTIKESGNKILIKIFSPSRNEEKTFRISYIVKNVAVKYNDIAELYYKFIGNENETKIGNLIIYINLPKQASNNQVEVFAHGPLNGNIYKIDNMTYKLEVNKVPTRTYVEGRVLFPKEFIALSDNTKNVEMYSSILEEETAYQHKLERDNAKKEALKKNLTIANLLASGLGLLIYIYVLFICRRNTKNYSELSYTCTPAIASLITLNFTGSYVIFASILDLVRKGYVSIRGEDDTLSVYENEAFVFIKLKEADQYLQAHEKYLMNWLFFKIGYGGRVSTSGIKRYSEDERAKFNQEYVEWKSSVKSDAVNKGFYDKSKRGFGCILIVYGIAEMILGICTAANNNLIALLTIIMGTVLLVYGVLLFFRLSDFGYEQHQYLMKLKKQVKYHYQLSMGNIYDSPDSSLIYGLALNTIIKQPKKLDQDDEGLYMNNWMFWYFLFVSTEGDYFRKSINNSFVVISDSGSESSGFSGGGGGGAGGGGAGGF